MSSQGPGAMRAALRHPATGDGDGARANRQSFASRRTGEELRTRLEAIEHRLDAIVQALQRLQVPPDDRGDASLVPLRLTRRQLEILVLLDEGRTTAQIAKALWVSPSTVRNHITAILRGLGAHSRLEAVATARRAGVLRHHANGGAGRHC